MEEMAISKFKATCLAVLERVRKTEKPIRVTRFGHVIAEIHPPNSLRRAPKLGTGIGTAVIRGDIVGPAGDVSDWEAWRDPNRVLDPTRKNHAKEEGK